MAILESGVIAQIEQLMRQLYTYAEARVSAEVARIFGQAWRSGKIDGNHVTTATAATASIPTGMSGRLGASYPDGTTITIDGTGKLTSTSGMTNPMTTLGDLIVGGTSGTPQRVGVGADTYVLTADHTATDGIKWAAASGGSAFSWVTKTANYTITGSDSGILVDASGGNVTIILLSAVGITKQFAVKRIDSSAHTVSLATTSSQTIDGASTGNMPTQYMSYVFGSDNTNWFVAAAYYPSPLMSKGDLIVADSNALPQRLAVGADTKRATANSAATLGVDWEP